LAQQKCRESIKKLEGQNAELNGKCFVVLTVLATILFWCIVQMTDMQRNLDAFRLDRLTHESLRQNCTNQLAMCKMKFGQLQGEFQQISTKLKVRPAIY